MTIGVALAPSRTKLDVWLLVATGILILFGLATLYSVDHARFGGTFFPRQAVFALIGVGLLYMFSRIGQDFIRRAVPLLYILQLGLLAVVLVAPEKNGAHRWIDIGPLQFQPSELSKFVMILTLATYFESRRLDIREWKTFWQSLGIAALPIPLLMKQPHLGASMSLLVIWFCMAFYSGISGRRLIGSVVAVVGAVTLLLSLPIAQFSYAQGRVLDLINPDAKGKGYQPYQAMLAIGNGGVLGQGYLRGDRIKGEHIPEQQNDFIFTVIGEEGGLVGCTLFLAALSFFFYRAWLVGFSSPSYTGRLLAAGVLGVLAFHTIVNLGMNTGVTPVIGLWLPFTSYGGTALWFCMSCVGLLLAARTYE
jgi:cell division protein FtsW (lipid II flippase)